MLSLFAWECDPFYGIRRSQALFELGIVGVDLGGAVVFVEIQFGDFWDLFHKSFLSSVHFPGSRAGKSGQNLTVKP